MPAGFRAAVSAAILAALLGTGPARAGDTRWQVKQAAPQRSGPTDIVMQPKFDHDPMKVFKGTVDGASGYTVLRSPNGETLRGIIERDGSGVLRDDNGRLHRIHTRW